MSLNVLSNNLVRTEGVDNITWPYQGDPSKMRIDLAATQQTGREWDSYNEGYVAQYVYSQFANARPRSLVPERQATMIELSRTQLDDNERRRQEELRGGYTPQQVDADLPDDNVSHWRDCTVYVFDDKGQEIAIAARNGTQQINSSSPSAPASTNENAQQVDSDTRVPPESANAPDIAPHTTDADVDKAVKQENDRLLAFVRRSDLALSPEEIIKECPPDLDSSEAGLDMLCEDYARVRREQNDVAVLGVSASASNIVRQLRTAMETSEKSSLDLAVKSGQEGGTGVGHDERRAAAYREEVITGVVRDFMSPTNSGSQGHRAVLMSRLAKLRQEGVNVSGINALAARLPIDALSRVIAREERFYNEPD
jgi:hypothetical protein